MTPPRTSIGHRARADALRAAGKPEFARQHDLIAEAILEEQLVVDSPFLMTPDQHRRQAQQVRQRGPTTESPKIAAGHGRDGGHGAIARSTASAHSRRYAATAASGIGIIRCNKVWSGTPSAFSSGGTTTLPLAGP